MQKVQTISRYSMRTRSNKEPDLIELLSSDEENNEKNHINELQTNSINKNTDSNECCDEIYSFRPWGVLYSDIESKNFIQRSKIDNDFEISLPTEFFRFGSINLNVDMATFRSNKGILLSFKS